MTDSYPIQVSGGRARIAEGASSEIIRSPGGRRRGDAILIAFNHAFEQGDIEVASQLLIEYQKINAGSPLLLTVDRRKRPDATVSILSHLWARLRSKFAS